MKTIAFLITITLFLIAPKAQAYVISLSHDHGPMNRGSLNVQGSYGYQGGYYGGGYQYQPQYGYLGGGYQYGSYRPYTGRLFSYNSSYIPSTNSRVPYASSYAPSYGYVR